MNPKFRLNQIIVIILLISTLVYEAKSATCSQQRCCLISPCTSNYCIQKNSETWISTQNFANYQYTKLVLSNNSCRPCPYNCKTCSSETSCTACSNGFYLENLSSQCLLCSDRCLSCTVVNSISKCSSCQDGSYLDSNTLTCKSCPQGAKKCSSPTAIIECQSGYKKTSNSLYCTSCPSNCLTCPVSDTACTSCSTGYYVSSSLCLKCNILNCISCLKAGSVISCTSCNAGYLVKSGSCSSCPSNCKTCSSTSVCTLCNSGYYLIGGACSLVGQSIGNCLTYSSSTSCSACGVGYYLSNSQCYPCSLLCATCDGTHFGQCLSCNSNSVLFNKMCLISNFPSTSTYNIFYSFPESFDLITSGSLSCASEYVVGSSISINLNNLKGYKLEVSWKLYSASGSTTYSVDLSNSAGTSTLAYATSNTLKYNNLCDNDLSTFYFIDVQTKVSFTSLKNQNTLKFYTNNNVNLALHEIVITVSRCSDLCVECSETLCSQCLINKLYTQDAYCVYTCSNNYYVYLNPANTTNPKQCLSDCPLGSYTLASNRSCVPCTSPCLTCLNQNFCLSCVDSYYLTKQNTCRQTCPYRFYGKVQTKTCEKCVGRCLQCLNQERCLSCKVGFLFNVSSACIDSCSYDLTSANGLYASLTTLYCENCNANCLNCEYSSTTCTQCASAKVLYKQQCLASCPVGYYTSSGSNICQACEYPCKTCNVLPANCTSCLDGYLYSQNCINDCPAGYYEDTSSQLCQPCDSKCTNCYASPTYCLTCQSSYYYFQNYCYAACPSGYYPQGSTFICTSCVNLCRTCLNQTYCLTCKSNFFYNGQCLSSGQCPSGFYADMATLACKACSSPCLECKFSPTYCTKCDVASTSGLKYLQSHTCKAVCSSDYFYSKVNATSATCQPCEEPCLTCSSATLCLSCISGYKYSNNVCSSSCSIATFFNSLINDCSNCGPNCQLCTSATFCQTCLNSFFVNSITSTQNQCLSACPTKYYPEALSANCQKCIYPCDTCSSSIDCATCLSGVLYAKRCISNCPDSTYLNILTNQCISCQGNCLTCLGDPLYCLSCNDGFYLLYSTHTCLSACPQSQYAQQLTKSCLNCPSTCLTCTNSTYCLACIIGKSYKSSESNICVQYCSSGYFGNNVTSACEACNAKCLTCKTTGSNCLSCAVGYFFIKISYDSNDCQTSCPSQYYAQSNYCYSCSFPCKSCSSSQKCLSCIEGTFYHKGSSSCLLNCPTQTFYNFKDLSCEGCDYPCESCDTNSSYCLSCNSTEETLYLYNGICIKDCPTGYYNDESGICNKCYGLCLTCSNKYECLSCLAGYVYNGFCYNSCPLGTFANTTGNACQVCDKICTQCVIQPKYCTKCSGGLFVYKGNCSSQCPIGTYQNNGQCKTCIFPCINCNSQSTCAQCLGGYLLYMNISCIKEVTLCPNDFYKMNSKYCVPVTWCPENYFVDQILKTCSSSCDRKKYTNLENKKCESSCSDGWYAGINLICQKWALNSPNSLMGMSAIAYVQSSYMYIQINFNETISWNDVSTNMYVISLVQNRLLFTQQNIPQYDIQLQYPTKLQFKPSSYPERININLPAYRVKSSVSGYPLQNPTITVTLPEFTAYSNSEIYSGMIMGQFSEGISWFIILLSFFFLFKNRLSDLYILWDTVQLIYLLLFLDIQYPPNLNEFFRGLKYTHFTFIPSMFASSSKRNVSDRPFYAYSYDNSFLRNTGGLFLALIVVLGILIMLKIVEVLNRKVQFIKQKTKDYPNFKSFIYKGILRYRWHHISDVMFLTYVPMILFAFAQINYMSQNSDNIFSNILAIASCIAYIIWMLFVGYKLHKHFKNISKGKMVNNLKCFYRGIQKQNKFGISLVLIRYARKLFYTLIISIFSANPMFALPILMFSSVLMALFLSINMPYKKKLSNLITLASEIVLVLLFVLLALINFNNETFNASIKHVLGWICCILLAIMIFALIYEVFCKAMFHLEPQVQQNEVKLDEVKQKMLNNKQKQYLRKKAEQFFNSLLPRLRDRLNLDEDSDDQLYKNYEEGDSENSQNNEELQNNWNDNKSGNSDQFKHYDNSENSQDVTAINSKIKIQQAPQYLVRCIKEIQ